MSTVGIWTNAKYAKDLAVGDRVKFNARRRGTHGPIREYLWTAAAISTTARGCTLVEWTTPARPPIKALYKPLDVVHLVSATS